MNTLWLSSTLQQQLIAQAQADAPHETCGVLFGQGAVIRSAVAITNRAADPLHSFQFDEREYIRALYDAEALGLTLIGFYHSHPKGEATPSLTDLAHAYYPDAAQVLIGLAGGGHVAAWQYAPGQAKRLDLHVSDHPPLAAQAASQPAPMLILSGLIASLMLILLALALLPPPPRLTP